MFAATTVDIAGNPQVVPMVVFAALYVGVGVDEGQMAMDGLPLSRLTFRLPRHDSTNYSQPHCSQMPMWAMEGHSWPDNHNAHLRWMEGWRQQL
jgi:hypothetical protein